MPKERPNLQEEKQRCDRPRPFVCQGAVTGFGISWTTWVLGSSSPQQVLVTVRRTGVFLIYLNSTPPLSLENSFLNSARDAAGVHVCRWCVSKCVCSTVYKWLVLQTRSWHRCISGGVYVCVSWGCPLTQPCLSPHLNIPKYLPLIRSITCLFQPWVHQFFTLISSGT